MEVALEVVDNGSLLLHLELLQLYLLLHLHLFLLLRTKVVPTVQDLTWLIGIMNVLRAHD